MATGELFPDGSRYYIGTTYAAELAVTAITNAKPAVASAVGHTLVDGDYLDITSPWSTMDAMVLRAEDMLADSFELGGFDTTDVTEFPASTNTATVRKIATWLEIPKITSSQSQGGEQQFAQWRYLAERIQRQAPTFKNPKSINLSVAYFPDLPHYEALIAADKTMQRRAIRVVLPNKDELVYNMFIGFDKQPTMTQGEIMVNPLVMSSAAPDFMRYKPLA